ncbi:unnamed protein product [Cuscuta campestris]|uniref:DUF7769 domain-containing protein n=1 Tax=Cuscuta campestris TaxID=132261 RepID=A0A484LKD2_9ASTE|nr:unnamed protein product [Cuscuta campestris]
MDGENPHLNTKKLENTTRQVISDTLLAHSKQNPNGSYSAQYGHINKLAAQFNVSRKTVSKIWAIAKKQIEQGVAIDVRSRLVGKKGRKRTVMDAQAIADTPLRKRTNVRSLAAAIGKPKSTVHEWINKGMLRSHSNAIKPFLTDGNKISRLRFYLDQVDPYSMPIHPQFKSFHNVLHIDEKWFYMSKTSQKFYLLPDEIDPHRTCKSKKFITKVMFLCVVGRPLFAESGEVLWDGKVGIFHFTETVQAQRKSKNRAKGVLEVKPITSVTKQVTKDMLIKQVIPCIQEKWPSQLSKDIQIQQDNARPHIQGLDSDFMAAGNTNGFHITLNNQPPNSLDLNILDLEFFRAIQSLKEQCAPTSVPELLEAVQRAYNALNPETLNKVWLTYQQVLTKVMEHEGSNNYRLPHMGKDRLAREGNLPKSLSIDLDLIQKIARLVGQQNAGRNEGLVEFNTEEGDDYLSSELN